MKPPLQNSISTNITDTKQCQSNDGIIYGLVGGLIGVVIVAVALAVFKTMKKCKGKYNMQKCIAAKGKQLQIILV